MGNPFAALGQADVADTIEIKESEEYTTEKQAFTSLGGDYVVQVGDSFGPSFPQSRTQHVAIWQDRIAYVTADSKVCLGTVTSLQESLSKAKATKSTLR